LKGCATRGRGNLYGRPNIFRLPWDDLLNKFGTFLKYFFYLHYYSLSLSLSLVTEIIWKKKEEFHTNEFHTNKVVVIIFYWLDHGFVWSLDPFMVDKIPWWGKLLFIFCSFFNEGGNPFFQSLFLLKLLYINYERVNQVFSQFLISIIYDIH
jgi:hypothetical protein